jgi:hypothetical protein
VTVLKTLLVLAGLVLAVWLLHRLAVWAEDRGWIYYRKKTGSATGLGNAFLEVQSLLEPGTKEVLEARLEDSSEETDVGAPPKPGE